MYIVVFYSPLRKLRTSHYFASFTWKFDSISGIQLLLPLNVLYYYYYYYYNYYYYYYYFYYYCICL